VGVMTEKHIEITPGSPKGDLLPPGSIIESKEVPSIMQITESFGDLNSQIERLLSRINDIFADENQNNFASMMQNMNNLIKQLQKNSSQATADFEVLTTDLTELTNDINAFMDENKGDFNKTLHNIELATKETNLVISEIRATLGNFQSLTSSNNQGLMEVMENLQITSQNLEEFSRMIKEQPWLLVRKAAPPERKIP
jgi:ABC-type transporter Mla subunit MlaD